MNFFLRAIFCLNFFVFYESFAESDLPGSCPKIISKKRWNGRKPFAVDYAIVPVKYVIIHHTVTAECNSENVCSNSLKSIQNFHMDTLEFHDIGYNFIIGGDGNVYEGAGWHKIGAHTRGYNSRSIGIAFIGNFSECCAPKTYELHFDNVSFAKALSLCHNKGAELATVMNEAEHEAIEKVVLAAVPKDDPSHEYFLFWIGGIRCSDCNNDDNEFIWLPKGQKQIYKNFHAKQPDNYAASGGQHCLAEVYYKGEQKTAWDDQECHFKKSNYICQKRIC